MNILDLRERVRRFLCLFLVFLVELRERCPFDGCCSRLKAALCEDTSSFFSLRRPFDLLLKFLLSNKSNSKRSNASFKLQTKAHNNYYNTMTIQ